MCPRRSTTSNRPGEPEGQDTFPPADTVQLPLEQPITILSGPGGVRFPMEIPIRIFLMSARFGPEVR